MKTLLGVCVTVSFVDHVTSFLQVTTFNPYAKGNFNHTSPKIMFLGDDGDGESWSPARDGRATQYHPFGELVPQENGMPITYVSVIDPSQVSHREKLNEGFAGLAEEEMEFLVRHSQGFVATS